MAQDPESRPISVSELLARSRREAGDEETTSTTSGRTGSGRRRVGRDGSISVAEITGEIPKITGPEPTSSQPRSSSPYVSPGESAFPRSSAPAPTSGAARTASGMPPVPPRPQTSNPADAQTDVTPVVDSPALDLPASEVPAPASPQTNSPQVDSPQTRDFNATAITGIIPVVDENAPDDDDLDFEAYRNFADYETGEPAATGKKAKPAKAKSEKPKKAKRGLFGRKKKSADTEPAADTLAVVEPESDASNDQIPAIRPSVAASEPGPAIVPSVRRSAPAPVDADADSGPAITPHVVARTPVTDQPKQPAPSTPEAPELATDDTQEISVVRSVTPSVTPAITPSKSFTEPAITPSSAPAEPEPEEPAHNIRTSLRKAITDDTEAGPIPDEAPLNSKHSPLVQWLLLIGQCVVGLAIGAGLFWGFTELWKWSVIFALVLAAVVIFGIVTLVHVVRRRHDLVSTLLALGVGLIVTIGPLVLLASSST
ncbi:hypothetical protein GOEFS_041_00170 [Gordonia effusa NBRC 100432]|uniref:Transmembrane protein n=1 Tax=Gordonia effusa NBRC 100432 TaxID=1077974 RepID=H0QYG2_9ACTN|nr:hypothetical protein [Gordonia effusa]GAB17863.1 hypothetical protein GOEFS_041_00170 [Gordonia effusa NBRC 100432]